MATTVSALEAQLEQLRRERALPLFAQLEAVMEEENTLVDLLARARLAAGTLDHSHGVVFPSVRYDRRYQALELFVSDVMRWARAGHHEPAPK